MLVAVVASGTVELVVVLVVLVADKRVNKASPSSWPIFTVLKNPRMRCPGGETLLKFFIITAKTLGDALEEEEEEEEEEEQKEEDEGCKKKMIIIIISSCQGVSSSFPSSSTSPELGWRWLLQ